jgi:hypothetical protein
LHNARLLRWGGTPKKDDRADAKDRIHGFLMSNVRQGAVRDRESLLLCLRNVGVEINRAGKDYISVIVPSSEEHDGSLAEQGSPPRRRRRNSLAPSSAAVGATYQTVPHSGVKLRLKGGIYAADWTAKKNEPEEPEPQERIARLETELGRIIEKRSLCNVKRYPRKEPDIEPEHLLSLPKKQEVLDHDRNRTDAQSDPDKAGTDFQCQTDGLQPTLAETGRRPNTDPDGITGFETLIQRCKRSVHEFADLVGEIEKRRIEREAWSQAPRMRMR